MFRGHYYGLFNVSKLKLLVQGSGFKVGSGVRVQGRQNSGYGKKAPIKNIIRK